jgi:acetyltransferase-like isoleucine patch superfamily enzyme
MVDIGSFTAVDDNVLIDSGEGWVKIGSRSHLKRGSTLRTYGGFISIGNRVSIGENCILAGHGGITIGDMVVIAGQCYISAQEHLSSEADTPIRFQGESARGISIGQDCWIGGGVMIRDGVQIGDRVVIGAGSVVTHSLPSQTMCWGSPCQPRRALINQESTVEGL